MVEIIVGQHSREPEMRNKYSFLKDIDIPTDQSNRTKNIYIYNNMNFTNLLCIY